MQIHPNNPTPRASYSLQRVATNVGAVAIGVIATFGFVKWQDQQSQLQELSERVAQMQAAPPTPPQVVAPPASEPEVVTRNAVADLTAVTELALAEVEPQVPLSAADQINAIMVNPNVELSPEVRRNAERLEALAIIDAGVQVLVDAVVEGNYEIHTDYEDEDFAGRIHFAFVGHEENQTALEQYIAQAAERGLIAHSASVVSSDGSINGHIMLFDLVERSLENGTPAEQAAGARMMAEAVALLNETSDEREPLTASGEQYYVVEAGDSLAYIALQFYGNTNDYQRIFDANRTQISSPERIRVGQRLLIPEV